MRKTDKKTELQLITVLTDICENVLKKYDGFQFITHFVNYANFPHSLKIICVFDTHIAISTFKQQMHLADMKENITFIINQRIIDIGIHIKNINNHITYQVENNLKKTKPSQKSKLSPK